jgi:replication-associated recombination protein RarA
MGRKKEAKQKMSNGFRERDTPLTARGYDIYELLSALQKDIRRCNEYQALHWAIELETYNVKALWNRLRVIASEDIGIANSEATVLVDVLEKHYFDAVQRKNDSSRLFLVHAVLYLARSQKSRIVDDLLITAYGNIKYNGEKLPIPDYALDIHTLRGKKMGRDTKFFTEESSRVNNEGLENSYKKSASEILLKYGKV